MRKDTARARVLCIEDDPEMIDLIRVILEQRGYEVVGMTTGAQGLRAARETRPDLVLLDLMMPGMDGWEVYRRLREDAELADVPVVVVTAKAQNIDRMLGLHIARVDDYVTKPFGAQELVDRMEAVLARSKARSGERGVIRG